MAGHLLHSDISLNLAVSPPIPWTKELAELHILSQTFHFYGFLPQSGCCIDHFMDPDLETSVLADGILLQVLIFFITPLCAVIWMKILNPLQCHKL